MYSPDQNSVETGGLIGLLEWPRKCCQISRISVRWSAVPRAELLKRSYQNPKYGRSLFRGLLQNPAPHVTRLGDMSNHFEHMSTLKTVKAQLETINNFLFKPLKQPTPDVLSNFLNIVWLLEFNPEASSRINYSEFHFPFQISTWVIWLTRWDWNIYLSSRRAQWKWKFMYSPFPKQSAYL